MRDGEDTHTEVEGDQPSTTPTGEHDDEEKPSDDNNTKTNMGVKNSKKS